METVFIALGSNIGDRMLNLETARNIIEAGIGKIICASEVYETEPWGHAEQPDFLNQVIKVKTPMAAGLVLDELLAVEERMGRIRTFKNAPRVIDLDILFYGTMIINEKDVTIPHPSIGDRKFVLAPLSEISPDFVHPVTKKTIGRMLSECRDPLRVHKLSLHPERELSTQSHYF